MDPESSIPRDLDQQKNNFVERLSNRGNFIYNKSKATIPSIDMVQPKQSIPTNQGVGDNRGTQQPQKPKIEKTQFKELFKTEDKLPERSLRNEARDKKEKEKKEDSNPEEDEEGSEDTEVGEGEVRALDEEGNEVVIEQPTKPKFPVFAITLGLLADVANIILTFFGFTNFVKALAELASAIITLGASIAPALADFTLALMMIAIGYTLKIMTSGLLFVWYHKKAYISTFKKIGLKVAKGFVKKQLGRMVAVKTTTILGSSIPIVNLIPFQTIFVIIAYMSGMKVFRKILQAIEMIELIEEKIT